MELGSTAYNAICSIPGAVASQAGRRLAAKSETVAKIATKFATTSAQIVQRASWALGVVCLPSTVSLARDVFRQFGNLLDIPPYAPAPSGLTLTRTTDTISLNWVHSQNTPGHRPLSAYWVFWGEFRWSDDYQTWKPTPRAAWRARIDKTTTTHTLTGLAQGTRYRIAVCTSGTRRAGPDQDEPYHFQSLLKLPPAHCVTGVVITSTIFNPPPTTTTTTTTVPPQVDPVPSRPVNLTVVCIPAALGSRLLLVNWNAPAASPTPIESYRYYVGGEWGSVPADNPIPQEPGSYSVSKTAPLSNNLVLVSSQGATQRSGWTWTRTNCPGS